MIEFNTLNPANLNPFDIIENVFDEDLFKKLKSEMKLDLDNDKTMGGRISQTFDPDHYDRESYKTWHQLYDFLSSQQLKTDLQKRYSIDLDYWNASADFFDPDLKILMQFADSWDGYWREPHYDTEGRLWSFIIFFNDKKWSGGDLITHSSDNVSYHVSRYFLKKLPKMNVIESKGNTGVFWLSTPNSYHSVSLQKNTTEHRKFIYGSLCASKPMFQKKLSKNINLMNLSTDILNLLYMQLKVRLWNSNGDLRFLHKRKRKTNV